MKLLQSLILLIGIVTGVNLKDERYTGEEQKRFQTYVQYFNTYPEPAMPASNEVQVAGEEPGPPNPDEIGTGVGASSATENDSSAIDADANETNGDSSDTVDDSNETNDKSSAVMAGTTACLLATLFSL